MAIIYPCHWCDRPVYVDEALLFAHDACCSDKECKEKHAASRMRMLVALGCSEEQARMLGI